MGPLAVAVAAMGTGATTKGTADPISWRLSTILPFVTVVVPNAVVWGTVTVRTVSYVVAVTVETVVLTIRQCLTCCTLGGIGCIRVGFCRTNEGRGVGNAEKGTAVRYGVVDPCFKRLKNVVVVADFARLQIRQC